MTKLTHIAQRNGRLSSFLLGELKMSTGLMNRLKWGDSIRVNGKPEHTDFAVHVGDQITVALEESGPEYPPEEGDLQILFEDEHLLVVDKPSGMLIHPSRSQNRGTLANLVQGHYRCSGQHAAFHPVTRLDRDTFGIVLVAKHSHAHHLLQGADIRKTYHAVVYGIPEPSMGKVEAPIARRPLPSLLRYISPEGKPSLTEYRVLERAFPLCKLELRPVTGRTHQLRLHCAHIGVPILGDPQYHSQGSWGYSEKMGIKTQLLCAKKLQFIHPITGESMELYSTMDAEIII